MSGNTLGIAQAIINSDLCVAARSLRIFVWGVQTRHNDSATYAVILPTHGGLTLDRLYGDGWRTRDLGRVANANTP